MQSVLKISPFWRKQVKHLVECCQKGIGEDNVFHSPEFALSTNKILESIRRSDAEKYDMTFFQRLLQHIVNEA